MGDEHSLLPGSPAGEPLPDPTETIVLLERARLGNRAALEEIFARYSSRLERLVRMRMGADLLAFVEPEDVVQETLIVAVRKLAEFVPQHEGSLLAWLDRIARGKIRDARASWKSKLGPLGSIDAPARDGEASRGAEAVDPSPGPRTRLRDKEAVAAFDRCVAALEPRQRELVVLKEYSGAPWPQIVAELGFPNEHAAQQAWLRVKEKLRECLARRMPA